ncbi:M15 family metallopeptidase [Lacrimispora indolis]|uniref:M15 family metallopeptidase n=1 Tax=Lacrimispora indolis TaxID=69825 RepID=UPI00045E82FD|nr:M15 family metallopeptidase [Lacrimispora indolis]
MNKRKKRRRKPYFGSVRFFRHLILTTIALLIIIPTGLAAYFKAQNKRMVKESYELYSENLVLQRQADMALNSETVNETEPVRLSSDKYGEILVDTNSWELMLVNDAHPLSQKFQVNLVEVQPGQSVDSRIVKDLQDMMEAAENEGYELHIYSSFRDLKRQQSLFNDCLKRLQEEGMDYQQAFYESKARLALPGTSEHQTGLAVDIAAKAYYYLDEERGGQKEAVWLEQNCYRYGFVLRYPKDKENITGIRYEPEHFRYVGKTVARFLTENDLVLEEFYDILQKNGRLR